MTLSVRWQWLRSKRAVPWGICAAVALVLAALDQAGFTPLQALETYQQNLNVIVGRPATPDPRLFFLAIDKPTYRDDIGEDEVGDSSVLAALRENYPWSRAVYGDVIERLMQAQVKLIIFDLLLLTPGRGDDVLRAALEKYGDRVIIGCNFTANEGGGDSRVSLMLPSPTLLGGVNHENVSGLDPRVGYVNIWPDGDGIIRHTNLRMLPEMVVGAVPTVLPNEHPETMYSLVGRALQKLHLTVLLPDSWEDRAFRFSGPPHVGFPAHSLYEIFLPSLWKGNYRDGEILRDKIVLVGPAGNWSHDEHPTPYPGLMPGPEIHLNILSAALQRDYLHEAGRGWIGLVILCAGMGAFGVTRLVKNPLWRLGAGLLVVVGLIGVSLLSYNWLALYVPTGTASLAFLGGLVLTLVYQFVQEQYERTRLRGVLDRYMSKDLVKDVLENPNSYFNTVGGTRKPVSILFSDVRGFTTMAEGADPGDLVRQLNEYLAAMVGIVFDNKGTLDKFIGDAVMAVWGNVVSAGLAADAARAVRSALQMRMALVRLNEDWKSRGIMELAFGIGINHGEVIVGNVGSEQKMEITVIGDSVNLASRLESLTKEYHLDLLIGDSVATLVADEFYLQMADNVRVKGKMKPVRVFAVLGEKAAGGSENPEKFLEPYRAAMEAYQKGDFAAARPLFAQAELLWQPNDLAKIYLERCDHLLTHPPETWDGVYVMTKK